MLQAALAQFLCIINAYWKVHTVMGCLRTKQIMHALCKQIIIAFCQNKNTKDLDPGLLKSLKSHNLNRFWNIWWMYFIYGWQQKSPKRCSSFLSWWCPIVQSQTLNLEQRVLSFKKTENKKVSKKYTFCIYRYSLYTEVAKKKLLKNYL